MGIVSSGRLLLAKSLIKKTHTYVTLIDNHELLNLIYLLWLYSNALINAHKDKQKLHWEKNKDIQDKLIIFGPF